MEEERFYFENLKVYQKALDYVNFVYKITKDFPKTEAFSMVDQFRRASTSICLNIAEGSGGTKADFNRFLVISRRSVRECIAVTEISHKQGFINVEERKQSRNFCFELSRMLTGLIKSLKNKEVTND